MRGWNLHVVLTAADKAPERQAKAVLSFSQDVSPLDLHPPNSSGAWAEAGAQTFPRLCSAAGPKTQAGRELGRSQVPAHVL